MLNIVDNGKLTVNVPPTRGVLKLSDPDGPIAEIELTTPFVLRPAAVTVDGEPEPLARQVFFEFAPVPDGGVGVDEFTQRLKWEIDKRCIRP